MSRWYFLNLEDGRLAPPTKHKARTQAQQQWYGM